MFNNQFTYVHGGFFLDYQDVPPQGGCAQSRYTGSDAALRRPRRELPLEHPVADQPHDGRQQPLADGDVPDDAAFVGSEDATAPTS